MSEAPTLTRDELSHKLGELFKRRPESTRDPRWRRQLAALHGRCEAETIDVEGEPVELVPVASEFELRMQLPDPHERRRLAFVLAYPAVEVPVDLAGRFVKRGRVVRIGKHERLRQLFSGQAEGRSRRSFVEIEGELESSALGAYLLSLDASELRGLAGASARVGLKTAYRRWLHVRWGLPERPAHDELLSACALNGRHAEFAAALDPARSPAAAGVCDELLEVFAAGEAPASALILRAWMAGKGRALLGYSVLCEAWSARRSEALGVFLRSQAPALIGTEVGETELERLAEATPTALELFAERAGSGELRRLLTETEAGLGDYILPHLCGSRRLPHAWTLRLDAVGEALLRAAEVEELSAEERRARYAALRERIVELELHAGISTSEGREAYAQAEHARRLAAWLVVRSDRRWSPGRGEIGKLEALAGWYAQEGGFVDLARRRLRSVGEGRFGAGVRALLAKVDAARVEQDRSFAAGLPRWLEDGRPDRKVLPIDKVLDRLGAGFLRGEGGARRRLLVLVLDGMAWAQAVELLMDLGDEESTAPWHPLACNRELAGLDRGLLPPVISSLPTVTEVSRAALFAGEPVQPGVTPRTTEDDRRWAAHAGVAPLVPGSEGPPLLTGRQAFVEHGLSPEARTSIADPRQPAVAVLVNTIDDALKANDLDERRWTVAQMRHLRALFEAAREAGRAVLMCSDHGNVSGQRLRYAGAGAGGSPRWRPWLKGESIKEYELGVPAPPGWRPDVPGAQGVVLINDDVHAYGGQRHYGEHGGATLAEVLAPALLLGTEELGGGAIEDPRLRTTPFTPPPWWLDEIREGEGRKAAVEAELAKRRHKPAEPAQLPLTSLRDESADTGEAEARARVEARERQSGATLSKATRELLAKLERNELFNARAEAASLRADVLRALRYLLEVDDKAAGEAFAAHMGKRKRAAPGLASTLSQVLNVDGYEVLAYEQRSKLVVLDRELLVQGFGL